MFAVFWEMGYHGLPAVSSYSLAQTMVSTGLHVLDIFTYKI